LSLLWLFYPLVALSLIYKDSRREAKAEILQLNSVWSERKTEDEILRMVKINWLSLN